jgi:hypothetical protein
MMSAVSCTVAVARLCKLQNLERWLANSQTPPDSAAQVRALIDRDAREDLSGTRPYFKDGQWFFRHPTLAVVARRLGGKACRS